MKTVKPASQAISLSVPLLLIVVLACLFWRSFLPNYVLFSNDGPLGVQNAAWMQMPDALFGQWDDLNSIGSSATIPLNLTVILLLAFKMVSFVRFHASVAVFTVAFFIVFGGGFYFFRKSNLSRLAATLRALALTAISLLALNVIDSQALGFAKFYAPVALFIVGLSAWFFFRQLKLSPLAATLGALSAMLNSTFFRMRAGAPAEHVIALGMDFFALGLVAANRREMSRLICLSRLALAGLCVGMNVMEAYDIGALYSVFVAAFVLFKSLVDEDGPVVKKLANGIGRVAVVAVFAGFIALQTVLGLVGTQIQGVAGTGQDAKTKADHWDFATQWSLPKTETIGLLMPGLFGYKMDTPQNMMPALQDAYRGGVYWGGIGRTPELDRYFDSGGSGPQPPGTMRFSGGGNYCGILVLLIAAWTIAQSLRRQNSPFAAIQKKYIWFWSVVLFGSLLMTWGRFAPFYALPYQLPYFSTIRNPAKFLFFLSWAIVILFGFGIHALNLRYLEIKTLKSSGVVTRLQSWWSNASSFDRKWTYSCLGIFGASVLGWFIYSSEKPVLVRYLQARGFSDEDFARQIITFSIGQVSWWLALFAAAIILFTLVIAGYFAGARTKMGRILLGVFLIFDLGRANLPYIIHWDYKQKYEIGTLNPIEEFLRNKPYEHRVAKLLPPPLSTPSQFGLFDELYEIEWKQQHFPYYNIQCLDIIQRPRTPLDELAYETALSIGIKKDATGNYMLDETTFPKLTRMLGTFKYTLFAWACRLR